MTEDTQGPEKPTDYERLVSEIEKLVQDRVEEAVKELPENMKKHPNVVFVDNSTSFHLFGGRFPLFRKSRFVSKSMKRFLWTIPALALLAIAILNLFPLFQGESGSSGRDELRELRHDERQNLIVFVHGIRDDGNLTWTNGTTNATWPEMLAQDERFESFDLSSYHYSSLLFQNGSLSISEVADQLAFRLDQELVDSYESIVFVAHSMGGLVVRNLLLKHDYLADQVPLIYFLATPTAGADIARLANVLDLGNRQLDAMTSFEQSNFLQDQSSSWRASSMFSEIYSLCAFENRTTFGVLVVNQASAESLCTERTVPSGESHAGIAKPYSEDSIVYDAFADQVVALFDRTPELERTDIDLEPSPDIQPPPAVVGSNVIDISFVNFHTGAETSGSGVALSEIRVISHDGVEVEVIGIQAIGCTADNCQGDAANLTDNILTDESQWVSFSLGTTPIASLRLILSERTSVASVGLLQHEEFYCLRNCQPPPGEVVRQDLRSVHIFLNEGFGQSFTFPSDPGGWWYAEFQ